VFFLRTTIYLVIILWTTLIVLGYSTIQKWGNHFGLYIYKYVFPSAFNIFNRCGKIGKPTVTVVMIWSFLKEKYWVPSTSIFVCWAFLAHPTWTKELCNHMPLLQTLPEGDGCLNGLNGWKPWPIYRWCSQLETSIYGWDFPWLC
jgi:hypothetical protein